MENYSYSSYPDSHDSSPRSRENESWDDQQPSSNYKVKFMCSYGGKIHPRPHDNQLTYVGGETKILAVDRNIRFSSIISKLSSFCDNEVCFKYQLPGEDLDALISVTNDEDLEHMMLEYDRIYRVGGGGGSRPARLRLFLFPLNPSNQSSFSADDPKPSQQWFVDALNAVPIQALDSSSPPASATNTDFLFGGFDKQQQNQLPLAPPAIPPVTKIIDPKPETLLPQEPKIVVDERAAAAAGGGEMFEIQRQIQELQRLQIANHEQQQQAQAQQAFYQRKNEANMNPNPNPPRGAFHGGGGDYYISEKQIPVSVPPAAYWQDRHPPVTGGYPEQMVGTDRQQQQQQQQQQMYMNMMQPQAGLYQTPGPNMRQQQQQQVPGHVSQGYYGIQRVVPDVYRDQPVYSVGPPPQMQQQAAAPPQPQITKMMVGETGGGYTTAQVGYDSSGRQVYYATTGAVQPGGGPVGVVPSSYPTAVTTMSVDPRQTGTLTQEGKVVKPPQASV